MVGQIRHCKLLCKRQFGFDYDRLSSFYMLDRRRLILQIVWMIYKMMHVLRQVCKLRLIIEAGDDFVPPAIYLKKKR